MDNRLQEFAIRICRMTVTNLCCFDTLDLRFDPATMRRSQGQWLVIVGQNGTGKTSLLRGIALALLPRSIGNTLLSKRSPMIRYGAEHAEILVDLHNTNTGVAKAHIVSGCARERLDLQQWPLMSPLVLGYGYHCNSASDDPANAIADFQNGCATLFDNHAPLVNIEGWLQREKARADEGIYPAVCALMENILDVQHMGFDEANRLWVDVPKLGRMPLAALGDSYLTTSGWIVDMIARWADHARSHNIELANDFHECMPCIVLIDGIDLHMHPRWRSLIVERLRIAFPLTTFIATTKNPLALSGLHADEVVVLEFAGARRVARQPGIRPGLLTTTEILEMFFGVQRRHLGNHNNLLQRYSCLAHDPLRNDEEHAEMLGLRARLEEFGIAPLREPVGRRPG